MPLSLLSSWPWSRKGRLESGLEEKNMEETGIPAFIAIIAAAVMVIGVIVGMAVITWMMLFASA